MVGHLFLRLGLFVYLVSDVINVSGHRMSTAEIESALILHNDVAEAAGASIISRNTLCLPIDLWCSYRLCRWFNRSSSPCFCHIKTVSYSCISVLQITTRIWDLTRNREFTYDAANESTTTKKLTLQVRKVIGPFAAPKKIYLVSEIPKTRSGKVFPYLPDPCPCPRNLTVPTFYQQIMRRIMRKIIAGEGDQLGDLSSLAEPGLIDALKRTVARSI